MKLKSYILAIGIIGFAHSTANAAIVWQWSFNEEAGTLTTDGDLVNGLAPAGTYNVTDFSVTASAFAIPLGSMSGGQWNEGSQPGTGFVWSGTADTQWFRDNNRIGSPLTNGTTYYSTPTAENPQSELVQFAPNNYSVAIDSEFGTVDTSTTLTLAPTTVPEPSSTLLLGLSGLALTLRRSRR